MLGSFEDKLCLCDWVTRRHKEAIYQRLQRNLQADYEEEEYTEEDSFGNFDDEDEDSFF